MKGSVIAQELRQNKVSETAFIRWWRKENDFVDYELVKNFLADADPNQEFGGYEVLDLQQMWETLQRTAPEHVSREKRGQREVIVWKHQVDEGDQKVEVCNYSPQAVMTIFDVETRGNVIDG